MRDMAIKEVKRHSKNPYYRIRFSNTNKSNKILRRI